MREMTQGTVRDSRHHNHRTNLRFSNWSPPQYLLFGHHRNYTSIKSDQLVSKLRFSNLWRPQYLLFNFADSSFRSDQLVATMMSVFGHHRNYFRGLIYRIWLAIAAGFGNWWFWLDFSQMSLQACLPIYILHSVSKERVRSEMYTFYKLYHISILKVYISALNNLDFTFYCIWVVCVFQAIFSFESLPKSNGLGNLTSNILCS